LRLSECKIANSSLQSAKGGGQISLLNIITELKKCCNHPFLFESAEADFRGSAEDSKAVDRLVVSAGKMVLLDKLLRRLKETGHRCRPLAAACLLERGALLVVTLLALW
jgi:SNF2 family DNA or RNA helicase